MLGAAADRSESKVSCKESGHPTKGVSMSEEKIERENELPIEELEAAAGGVSPVAPQPPPPVSPGTLYSGGPTSTDIG